MLKSSGLPKAEDSPTLSSQAQFQALLEKSKSAPCANVWLCLAKHYLDFTAAEHNPQEGYQSLLKATALDDTNSEAWLCLAECYLSALGTDQDLEKAFQYTQKATECDNTNSRAWASLATFYHGLNGHVSNPELALHCYENAIKADPQNPYYWVCVADIHQHNKPELAFQSYKKAIELNNDDALGWVGLRTCYCHGIGVERNLNSFLDCQKNIDRIHGNPFIKEDHEFVYNLHSEFLRSNEEEAVNPAQPFTVAFDLMKDQKSDTSEEPETSKKRLKKR